MTNWRNLNPVNKAAWDITLLNAGSPLYPTRDECYAAAGDLSGLALAMMRVESQFGVAWNANEPSSFNVLNLRPRGGLAGFQRFSSWAEGIAEFRARLLDPLYAYVISNDIPSLIHLFAPASDNNDERAYASSVAADLARWDVSEKEETMALYTVAGLSQKIELPVPLIIDLIPKSQTRQRPGIIRQTPGYWVQHETDNPSPGADAAMHSTYLKNGAEGRQASWHFTVDDGVIYQHLPVNEVGWHAADGGGPGNMSGIGCELCINAGIDIAKSRHNAEALCGGIMKAQKMTPDRIKRHWDFNAGSVDRHHCPDRMMNSGYWPTFTANATKIIVGGNPVPDPTMTYIPGLDKALATTWFGRVTGDDGKTYAFDENGAVSQAWIDYGEKTGQYPKITSVKHYGERAYFTFASGLVLWSPNAQTPFLPLAA